MANETQNLVFPLTEDGSKLSHEFGLQPLMRGQVVRYKLIESDEDDPSRTDLSGKHLKKTPGYLMVGKKIIYDHIAGKQVTIMTPSVTKKFKTVLGEVSSSRPISVKFMSDKPMIEVHWNQPELYAFLELANENLDNPRRDGRKVKARYYRVDPRKKLNKETERDAFELDALLWISKTATFTELKACAEYVNSQRSDLKIKNDYPNAEASIGYALLKKELYALAKKDPHLVLKGSTKIDAQMKMQIIEAEGLSLILYFDEKTSKAKDMVNTWYHNDSAGLQKICTVEVGENRHEALMNFLASDKGGKEHYKKIIMTLEKFLKPQ